MNIEFGLFIIKHLADRRLRKGDVDRYVLMLLILLILVVLIIIVYYKGIFEMIKKLFLERKF